MDETKLITYILYIILGLIVGKILSKHISIDVEVEYDEFEKRMRHEAAEAMIKEYKEKVPQLKDDSEDFIYVTAHETDNYVHLWKYEPALDAEQSYLGRFPKYDEIEYCQLIDKIRVNKGVRMPLNSLSSGMQDMLQRIILEAELNQQDTKSQNKSIT